jgi:linoleate 10R-lipoxygenase
VSAPSTTVTNGEQAAPPAEKPVAEKAEKEPAVTNDSAPKALKEFREQIKKSGFSLTSTASTVSAVVDLIRNQESIDDRKLLLEHALVFVSRLEEGPLARTLKNKIVQLRTSSAVVPPSFLLSATVPYSL